MATANQVSQLFVALYNRAIDGVTAQQYGGRAYNQGFISEVIGLVPNLRTMTNQEFVELVYKNALGKDNNSDKAGIDYWVSQANDNNWRREQLTDNLLRSINAWADQNADTTNLTPDQITLASQGATVFRTKVAIAEQAATTVGGQADDYALTFGSGLEEVTFLNYNTARENNTKILQGIAARNPLAQSGGATLALGVNPDTGEGQESFLPTDPNPPASGASKYVASTKFDDVVTGTVALTDPTFTADTQIDAGAGNDTLKLNMSTSFTGLSGDGKVTGVERIELTNTTVNDNVTFNASGIRDVYTYVLNGANGINLTNIAYNEYLLIEMNNIKSTGNTTGSSGAATVNNGGVTQITFDTTPTGGRLDLNFNGVGYDSTDNRISNHDILFGIGSGSAIDPNGSADDFANQAAGIGILNIALTGNNYADIVNTGVNRITVGGNGSLTTNLSKGVTYFNGANATGSLNITATDKKETGENGTNIFEYFATGSAADKVHIAVERLGQNATVNLGLGDDTLILSGEVDHEARKQFYNFNTIENLVFQDLTGDSLLIDLGTTIVTTPQDPIISGSGSKKTEIPQDPIITTTQDRSANLQTITFEDGASVQLTSLGKKDLKVTYNGATDTQKVLVDTEGTVDLVLQGSDTGTAGTGKIGAGFVNLSNAKKVNVDLTGQGFEGYLSAGNAVDLNINNYTGDKKLKLKANTLTEKNDLSSVVNLTIDTEAQDINPSGSGTANSVDIANADLASISKITLKGTGGIKLGELANKEGITIAGENYSGRLETGNIYAGSSALNITTKGAITTGNLTGNNITIDLSKNITTTEGQYNNNIGTIYVERVDAGNNAGTLNYTTGISGTQGIPNADGTANDTQSIVVNTNNATLNINGAGGVDKFNIEASSFTKTLTIAGNLGTVPNYEEAKNNYDTVRIDLSKTSGVNLDISKLLVSNPNNEGIVITASKGADNIILTAGANHDVVEFAAGGGAAGAKEEYTVELGNLRLGQGQSFTIDGLTITNVSGFTNGTGVLQTATIYTAEAIAELLRAYLTGATSVGTAVGNILVAGSAISKYVKIEGKLDGLTTTNGWLDASGNATVSVGADGKSLIFENANFANVSDLNFTFGGNGRTDGYGPEANKEQSFTAGKAAVAAKTTASGNFAAINASALATGTTKTVDITFNNETYALTLTVSSTAAATAAFTAANLAKVLSGSSAGIANLTTTLVKGSTTATISGLTFTGSSAGTFTVSNLGSGDSIKISGTEYAYSPATPAVQGQLVIDFGTGLLAGQSYTYLNKTIVATKDLTGEQIAEAFAFGDETSSGVDGAVVLGEWSLAYSASGATGGTSGGIDPAKVLFDISGSSLILMEQKPGVTEGLKIDGFTDAPTLTGTGTLAVRTDGVTGSTTQQGEKDGQLASDSYVTFNVVGGSAPSGAGSAGVVTVVNANTNALDTITNFDISNDKLLLKDVNGNALSFANGGGNVSLSGSSIYVDTAGSTLRAWTDSGIINFGIVTASGAATTTEAITLNQKLYVAAENVANNAVVGFEHGSDTYVVLGGQSSGAGTDDLVIKLAGVTGLTDITSILA